MPRQENLKMEISVTRERGRIRFAWTLRPDLWDPKTGAWVSSNYRELREQELAGVELLGPRDIGGFFALCKFQRSLRLLFANTRPKPLPLQRRKA